METVVWKISKDNATAILNLLAKCPYEQVAGLIQNLGSQMNGPGAGKAEAHSGAASGQATNGNAGPHMPVGPVVRRDSENRTQ